MHNPLKITLTILCSLALSACGGSGSGSSNSNNNINTSIDGEYRVLSEETLSAEGITNAQVYSHIESVLGVGSIEAPDLYGSANHSGVQHILKESDNQVGDYFKFIIHRDLDGDRDTGKTDRQRNEIKVYGNSDDSLKGFLGKTFEYRWKFRVGHDLAITNHFTHLFQLKAVTSSNDPVSQPLVTITANTKSGVGGLEVRHVDSADNKTELLHTSRQGIDWATQIQGQWLEVMVRTTYAEKGMLQLSVTPLGESEPLFTVNRSNIEMWRSGSNADKGNFVRPKWGIYRSLNSKELLNAHEDNVDFANFYIAEAEQLEDK